MTVVVEAASRSGSLVTAGLAADRGREVGAVPGLITSRTSVGPNALLASGARVVRDAEDVIRALRWDRTSGESHPCRGEDRRG